MSLRNIIIGIVIGTATLLFVKNEPHATDQSASIGVTPAVATRRSEPLKTATKVNYAPAKTGRIDDPPATFAFPENPGRLRQLLKESTAEAKVVIPSRDELHRFEQLMFMTLGQPSSFAELEIRWSKLGWEIQRWMSDGQRFIAICEPSDERCGRGIYVIRADSQSRIALQAPHRFFDTQTGLLTRKLFAENDVRIACWNTVHREKIDLAHQSDHFINALTRALVRFDSDIVVAQLHGFDDQKRTTTELSAAMIISDATRYPGRLVRRLATEQKLAFGAERVKLFPAEVNELGGTQNEQARVFHSLGQRGFLHIELSGELRKKLTSDASERAQFFSALTTATANWQESRDR